MVNKNKIFTEVEVKGKDFSGDVFESCKFTNIKLKFTNFSECLFKSCDFSESYLDLVSFSDCKFPGSKLSFLDFGNTSLNGCDFSGTLAENCIFQKLKGSSKSDLKKFIFASTMETYGWQKTGVLFKEDIRLHPGSPYSVAKAACEYYIEMAHKAFGLPYVIMRPCNTYGRKHNAGFVVEYLVTAMLAGRDVYLGTPKAVRDMMYVDDHVNAYMTVLKSKEINQTFNFGTGSGVTMLALAKKIKSMTGFKGKIIQHFPPDYPMRPVTEEYLSLDASKAKKILGWKPRYTLDEGLKQTIAYWKNAKR